MMCALSFLQILFYFAKIKKAQKIGRKTQNMGVAGIMAATKNAEY